MLALCPRNLIGHRAHDKESPPCHNINDHQMESEGEKNSQKITTVCHYE